MRTPGLAEPTYWWDACTECGAGRRVRRGYDSGLCRACAEAERQACSNTDLLPAGPLLALLTRSDMPDAEAARTVAPLCGTRAESVERRLHRARRTGQVRADLADLIAVSLGHHPSDLWGREWA